MARRGRNRAKQGTEVVILRQRGTVPRSTSAGASMVSLSAPTGRGYRPIRASIQLCTEGTNPALAQIEFLFGKSENSPVSTREILLHSNIRTVRFFWPQNAPWCAEGEYAQNLVELDNICMSSTSGSVYYILQLHVELSATTLSGSCPTVDGQMRTF